MRGSSGANLIKSAPVVLCAATHVVADANKSSCRFAALAEPTPTTSIHSQAAPQALACFALP